MADEKHPPKSNVILANEIATRLSKQLTAKPNTPDSNVEYSEQIKERLSLLETKRRGIRLLQTESIGDEADPEPMIEDDGYRGG